MRIAWFDCFAGISGDMALGALIGAGWDRAALESLPSRLKLEGVNVAIHTVRRGPFGAIQVKVEVADSLQPHRHLHHVTTLLEQADLKPGPRATAAAVFRKLAEAEAEVHGTTVEKVHFHEVGAADALVDIVGAAEGLEALGVERVYSSPPRLGGGEVMSQHGRIPVPAPATVALLRGAPVQLGPISQELTTPTGAALLAALVESWDSPPAFRLERTGIGAGSRDPKELANVLRVLVGETSDSTTRRRVAVLETSLDDENPQMVGALIPKLLAAGALDAMVVPTLMKKGRPGLWLMVVAEPDAAERLANELLRESSTLGVRVRIEERFELERRAASVETPYGAVTLKVARLPDGTERAVPEFESVRQLAERSGQPLREIAEAAISAWRAGRSGK